MLTALLIISVLFGVLGYYIGRPKGWGPLGALLGLFLGVIGIVIIVLLRPQHPAEGSWRPPPGPQAPGWAPPAAPPGGYGAHPPTMGDTPGPFTDGTGTLPPGWVPDPTGRFEFRWWDGMGYTHHVATAGVATFDPHPVAP